MAIINGRPNAWVEKTMASLAWVYSSHLPRLSLSMGESFQRFSGSVSRERHGANSEKGSGGYLAFTPLDGTLPSIQSQLSRCVHRIVRSACHCIDKKFCAMSMNPGGTQRQLVANTLHPVP